MLYAWYTCDGNQAAGFWTLVWRVETGCRQGDIRRMSNETDFVVVLDDICRQKFRLLRHENVPLKHYTFPRTLKKISGHIALEYFWSKSVGLLWILIDWCGVPGSWMNVYHFRSNSNGDRIDARFQEVLGVKIYEVDCSHMNHLRLTGV